MNKLRSFLLIAALFAGTLPCLANSYSNQGAVIMTGTLTWIGDPVACALVNCKIGDTIYVGMSFYQPNWNATGSTFNVSFVTPSSQQCSTSGNACTWDDYYCLAYGYGSGCAYELQSGSNFGWIPIAWDAVQAIVTDGQITGMAWDSGSLQISGNNVNGGEWATANIGNGGFCDSWCFGGTIAPVYATPAPEPASFLLLLTGTMVALGVFRRRLSL